MSANFTPEELTELGLPTYAELNKRNESLKALIAKIFSNNYQVDFDLEIGWIDSRGYSFTDDEVALIESAQLKEGPR